MTNNTTGGNSSSIRHIQSLLTSDVDMREQSERAKRKENCVYTWMKHHLSPNLFEIKRESCGHWWPFKRPFADQKRYRIDFALKMKNIRTHSCAVGVEVDEDCHRSYDPAEEDERLWTLIRSLDAKVPFLLVRINPDSYLKAGIRQRSYILFDASELDRRMSMVQAHIESFFRSSHVFDDEYAPGYIVKVCHDSLYNVDVQYFAVDRKNNELLDETISQPDIFSTINNDDYGHDV